MTIKLKLGNLVDLSEFDNQGDRMIEVLLQDRMTSKVIGKRVMKRATLAKAFAEGRVVGSVNNMFKVEV